MGFGIGLSVLRPYLLGLLILLPIMLLAWRIYRPPLKPSRSRLSLALRLALVTLLVFTLAGVRVTTQPRQRAIVAVVDLSASARDSQDAEAAAVRSLAASKGPDDLFGVVTFGHDAAVELPPVKSPYFDVFQTQPDPNYTDVASALRLAAGLIPDGYARQLVLISDGRQNLGDGGATVAALRAEGVRVDVLAVGGPSPPEAMILSTEAPSEMRVGETATATVRLKATAQSTGQLALQLDGQEIAVHDVTLPVGVSTQTFSIPSLEPGLHRVRAELSEPRPDTYAQNNVGEAAIKVLGRPYVLVLEGTPGEGGNVEKALTAAGMKVDVRPAGQAPTDAAVLGRYDSIVVVDASAEVFPPTAMAGIADAVKSLGRGLVAIGGPNAYGPGGWQNTPLEEALPVRMDLPNRKEKPKVAVVLVMETMEDARADQVALGAAESVIDKLSPDDMVGVTDGSRGFIVDLQPVKDKKAINAKLESAALGDPPSYSPFITMAGDALKKANAPLKHIVLLGDGDAQPPAGQDDTQNVVSALKDQDITTSSIGIDVHGQASFMAYMQDIARWGGGRFYQSNDPSQVPQLFLKESQVALRPWFEQDPFFPKVAAGGDLLQGVPLDAFPQLGGYVVTTAKPGAEVYFMSPKQDPVLASGNYGLGRTVAWTSDSTGHWTGGFLRSPVSATLFARMVDWTLPTGGPEKLTVEARPSGDSIQLTVTGPDTSGGSLNVGVLDPDLEGSTTQLALVAPGRWQGQIPATSVGTYDLHSVLTKGGQLVAQSDTAVVVPYPPEYLDLGRDDAFLRGLAQEGGTLLSRPAAAWGLPALPVPISTDIFWILLLVVAVLWPLDVAMRRLTLTPRQVGSLVAAIVARRRPAEVELIVPELARLRGRVAGVRRRRAVPAPRSVMTGPPEPPREVAAPVATAPKAEVDQEALSARLLEARRKRRGKGD